jgi:hypothetical protein
MPTFEVGQHAWTPACGERQVHRGGLAARFGCWLVEVGVPIDEQQPVTASSAQCEQVAEQDRAVAAEHDRDLPMVEDLTGRRGEQMRVVAKPCCVEHAGDGVTPPVVGGRAHTSAAARPEPVGEACRQQRLREPLDAAGEEPEYRRSLDDHIAGDAPFSLCAVGGIDAPEPQYRTTPSHSAERIPIGISLFSNVWWLSGAGKGASSSGQQPAESSSARNSPEPRMVAPASSTSRRSARSDVTTVASAVSRTISRIRSSAASRPRRLA